MPNADLEIVVEDPTAPEVNSPAVTNNRTVEIAVSLLLLALAATLGYENWRTGVGWDSTGPQPGYFPFYLSVILAAASLYGLLKALRSSELGLETFVTQAQAWRVLAVFVPTLAFCLVTQFLGLYVASFLLISGFVVEVASDRLHLHRDHVRHFRHHLRRHHAERTARSGLRLLTGRRKTKPWKPSACSCTALPSC
jgi:putative tricarboxylic transport membrane protein